MTRDPDVCPHCNGTGKGNPLPPSRYGPGPCITCKGTGKRPQTDQKAAA
jgi:DnaJ-class molecular chaperone